MAKHFHEFRDAVHVFVHLDSDERKVVDSRPFQRLRHIHQLGLTHQVYPGATHRRFEHSLGVMELADRVFQVITADRNRHDAVRRLFPPERDLQYWRLVLRMAALCHDIGHLPFSHAAESTLLPDGCSHETLTVDIINSREMNAIWSDVTPPLRRDWIAKLAVGPKKLKNTEFSPWERILAEVIVGDSFGVDRMDYLLRDSLHLGVVYGKFDHYRLIDTLRVLPENEEDGAAEPMLGIESGGLHSAEALLLARYFMYSQVYFHPVRRIYDIHLQEFLAAWLGNGRLPKDPSAFLEVTDEEVSAAIRQAAHQPSSPGHDAAARIVNRGHFRLLYERNPDDAKRNPEAGQAVFNAACRQFGADWVRHDRYTEKGSATGFPVLDRDARIVPSLSKSDVLKNLPLVNVDYVFAAREIWSQVKEWLDENRESTISQIEAEDQE